MKCGKEFLHTKHFKLKWISAFVLVVALAFFSNLLHAQDLPDGVGPEAGHTLAQHLLSMQPTEAVKWRGALKISGRDRKTLSVPVLSEITPGTGTWSVMYLAAATSETPAEKLTIIFSTNAPNQYVYARAATPGGALEPPRTLSGSQADIPLAGSDFWLSDLGFEFYHWPDQDRMKGQMRRGRPCYVLQSVNPNPEPAGYSRVVTWIDKESLQPLIAEAYGRDGKLMKEFELGSVAKVNGRYQVKDLKMINRKNGTRTDLDFDLKSQ